MKIIEAGVQLITPLNSDAVLKRLEECGRVCYKSEDKIDKGTASTFVKNIIDRGHESVLEHCSLSVKFICDRAIANEIVRHRLASYSQESTRYCNYTKCGFGSEITVIKPCFWNKNSLEYNEWLKINEFSELTYLRLVESGVTPQEARSVLTNSLKTEIVMTANLREWRHFLKLRCDKASHPQMREIALKLLEKLHSGIDILFDDIADEFLVDKKGIDVC